MSEEYDPLVRRLSANVGRELAAARRASGKTQMQVAREAGLQQALVSRVECGHSNPTLKSVCALAETLDLDIEVRFVFKRGRRARLRRA